MKRDEFDRFADEYEALHAGNIGASGEAPSYFAEYKAIDLRRLAVEHGSLPAGRHAVVLDFGGGVGNCTEFLLREFAGSLVVNVDVSQRSLRVSQARCPDASQVVFDGEALPLATSSVDCVLCACVFHHIDAGEHVAKLAELRRVMRPGALLMIYEHNPVNPLTRRAVNTCPFDANAHLIGARTMRARFRDAGFRDAKIRYRVFFPRFARALRPLERSLYWLPLGAQYLVYARR
ncbi:MAG: class I SAM-dependent methyltransferase [Burkholderiales bacterium]|nr:MAG: class I SAM-dependent methyltransferase [Burkholderiales bacterium]